MKNPLSESEIRLLDNLLSYSLNEKAFEVYIKSVKRNKDNTYEITRKKLIRNIVLGHRETVTPYRDISCYGNLAITYNHTTYEIVHIKNREGNFKFDIDENKKEWLDIFLGLKEEVVKDKQSFISGLFNLGGLFGRKRFI